MVEYALGQFYEPHNDYFIGGGVSGTVPAESAFTPPSGSNRFATLVIYLTDSDAEGGGQTVFPLAAPTNTTTTAGGDRVSFIGAAGAPGCDFPSLLQRRGLMVTPRRGDAILFYNQRPDGSFDERTRHGSCPVLNSRRKVAANIWLWNKDVIYR